MAAKYIKVSASPETLLSSSDKQHNGNIKSINISGATSTGALVGLYLDPVSTTEDDIYIIKDVLVPQGASLFLDKGLSFDISKYSLKITTTVTGLSIIIK